MKESSKDKNRESSVPPRLPSHNSKSGGRAAIGENQNSILKTIWLQIFGRRNGKLSLWEQLTMYLGIFIGVYFSSHLKGQQQKISPAIAALTALLIMPTVFEKLNIDPNSPFIVRFSIFVQHGVFWDVLFGAIGKSFQS